MQGAEYTRHYSYVYTVHMFMTGLVINLSLDEMHIYLFV
jgi:hypothetical protein